MHPATEYCLNVISGEIPACRYVRLACQRHLNDLKRDDVWFDEAAADRFYNYCTFLKHYKGRFSGKPITLHDWQKFVFGCVYGWKKVINKKKTDLWRFNIVYIEIPRKNGKTTVAAACASYDSLAFAPMGAEVYCLATKEDQSKVLVNDICAYIAQSDVLADEFLILKGKSTIFVKESSRTSFVRPLGSDSKRQDGLNPFGAYCDELHQWPNRNLWDVMEDAFGARENWHMVAITTAGFDQHGICYSERSHLINILEGHTEADNKFGVIYTIDPEDMDNPHDEACWYKANPNLGRGKELEYMRHKSRKAQQIPTELNAFLNKQLDVWTDAKEAWLNLDAWKKLQGGPSDLKKLEGMKCRIGIDLAEVNDLSAVTYIFPKQPGLPKPHFVTHFYMPEEGLREKGERDGVDYITWQRQGLLFVTPGKTTDFNFIRADILQAAEMFTIEGVGYDPFKSGQLVKDLENEGVKVIPVRQNFVNMGPGCATFERMIVSGELTHEGNPIMAYCVSNAVTVRDPGGLMRPDKSTAEKMKKRIDGVVSAVNGVCILDKEIEEEESVYENQGLRVL